MSDELTFNPSTGPIYTPPPVEDGDTPLPPTVAGAKDDQTSAGGKLTLVDPGESSNPGVSESPVARDIPPSDLQTVNSNRFFAGNAAVTIAEAMQEFLRTQKEIGMESTDNAVLGLKTTVELGENAANESLAAGSAAATKEIVQGSLAGANAALGVGTGVQTLKGVSSAEKGLDKQIKAGEAANDAAKTKATDAGASLSKNTSELDANKKLLNEVSPQKTTSGTASVTKQEDDVDVDTFVVTTPAATAKKTNADMTVEEDNPMEARYVAGSTTGRERSETVYSPLPNTLDPTPTPAAATPAAATSAASTPAAAAPQTAPAANTPEYDAAKASYDADVEKYGEDVALANLTKSTGDLQGSQNTLQTDFDDATTEATKAQADLNKMSGEKNLTLAQMVRGDPRVLKAEVAKGIVEPLIQATSAGVSSIFTLQQATHEANATEAQTYKAAQQTGLESSQEQRKNASSMVDSTIQAWNQSYKDSQVTFRG